MIGEQSYVEEQAESMDIDPDVDTLADMLSEHTLIAQNDMHTIQTRSDLEMLDKDYPGWQDHKSCKINMVPNIFINKGKKNGPNGAEAELKLFNTFESANDKSVYPRNQYIEFNAFVFHDKNCDDGTQIDFIWIDKYGVTVFECKGFKLQKQAQSEYRKVCAQTDKSIPKLTPCLSVPVNRVVAFPLCKRIDITEKNDTPTLFKEDCGNADSFRAWWRSQYRRDLPEVSFATYVAVCAHFLKRYHTNGDFKRHAISGVADCLERCTKAYITKAQKHILEAGNPHCNILVEGCAGSGKTFLLIERAKELARLYKDVETQRKPCILIVTYNVAINKYIESSLEKWIRPMVRLQTFSALLGHILVVYYKSEIPRFDNDAEKVSHILANPKICKTYFKSNYNPQSYKYRHILIDEAQDLSGRWLDLMKELLNKLESSIWCFSDPFQDIRRGTNMAIGDGLKFDSTHDLKEVVRNTHKVFDAYQHCFSTSVEAKSIPTVQHEVYGKSPEYIPVDDHDILLKLLTGKVTELHQNNVYNIAVLTQGRGGVGGDFVDKVTQFLKDGGFSTTDAEGIHKRKQKKQPVTVDTVQRFKGLESNVLILCIGGDWQPRDVDLYVAFSRCFCHLIVMGKATTIDEINGKQQHYVSSQSP